jgi:hypothetical protein
VEHVGTPGSPRAFRASEGKAFDHAAREINRLIPSNVAKLWQSRTGIASGLEFRPTTGLIWSAIETDAAQVSLEWQVQRVGRQLIHKHYLKSDGSTDVLPLPGICLSALKIQREAQARMRTEVFSVAEPVIGDVARVRGDTRT